VKPVLVQGTSIKGVSKSVKYVVTLPKFTGSELSKVRTAVSSMKKAWKSELGVDVTVRYGSLTTSEVQKIVKTLEKVR
jgi:urease accessory protein UreH